jgi:hypothetical protein
MKVLFSICTAFILFAAPLAQEMAVPDKPVVVTVTSYEVVGFSFQRYPAWHFEISYRDNTGKTYTDTHHGPDTVGEVANPNGAERFLKQMNIGNFGTVSLTRRLLQHLVQHGKIPAATVQGTPEK